MEIRMIHVYFLGALINWNNAHVLHKSGTIDENISWYELELTEYPALRYEVHFSFIFGEEICCPIVHIAASLQENYNYFRDVFLGDGNCFSPIHTKGKVLWNKASSFILQNNTHESGKCHLDQGNYTCKMTTVTLKYEPQSRWLILGYPCGQIRNLFGFQYEIHTLTQNTTQCESLNIPNNLDYFQCSRFYKYTTYPNLFAQRSQTEALRMLQMLQIIIENMDQPCYKYLDYVLCHTFFPQCPDGTNEMNRNASFLIVMCEKMCQEFVKGCYESLQPVINFADCSYYIRFSDFPCIYEQVTCDQPPSVENGIISSKLNPGETYPVDSIVTYSCDTGFELKGNPVSTCTYSGMWTQGTFCETLADNSLVSLQACVFSLLFSVLIMYVCKIIIKMRWRDQYFDIHPTQKRNKENDAFVSFHSDNGPDYKFVKFFLQPKLEQETNPPFKLTIHLRDFRADTLIYVNIRNAVVNSNSAIILMSQAYIDSRWCREEFEVTHT